MSIKLTNILITYFTSKYTKFSKFFKRQVTVDSCVEETQVCSIHENGSQVQIDLY